MNIIKWSDVEEKAAANYTGFVYNCEYDFSSQVYKIADDIFNKAKCRLVLVAGPSSSGKTTFTNILADRLEFRGIKVHRVSTDDFFRNNADVPRLPNGKQDFDSLNAMDLPLIKKTIKLILAGGKVNIPTYNFLTGCRDEETRTIDVQESDITIVEGIHALNPEVIGTYSMESSLVCGIFIRPAKTFVMKNGAIIIPDDLRMLRRSIRDYYKRGCSLEETANQWEEVLSAEKKTIYPFRDLADYQVDSVHPYELYVYKNCFGKILENCNLKEYENIKNALNEIIKKPRVAILENSLLNEFAIWPEDNK